MILPMFCSIGLELVKGQRLLLLERATSNTTLLSRFFFTEIHTQNQIRKPADTFSKHLSSLDYTTTNEIEKKKKKIKVSILVV